MRLVELEIDGLKAHDRTLRFGKVTVLCGPMGSGKTEAIQALQLLVRGEVPARGAQKGLASADKIMALARGEHIRVRGVWEGPASWAEREWVRKVSRVRGEEKITVKEIVSASFVPDGAGKAFADAEVARRYAGWAQAWAPDDLIDLPRDQLRRKLVQMIGGEDLTIERFLPADCPEWAKPRTGYTVVDWISAALAEAKRRAKEIGDEVDALAAQLDGMPFVPASDADGAATTARLAGLRAELVRAARRADVEAEIAKLRAEVEELRGRAASAPTVDEAVGALEAARARMGRYPAIVEQLVGVRGRLSAARAVLTAAGDVEVLDEEAAGLALESARRAEAEAAAQVTAGRTEQQRARQDRERRLAPIVQEMRALEQERRTLAARHALNPGGAFDPQAAEEAARGLAKAQELADQAKIAAREAGAAEQALGQDMPLDACPHCGEDLRTHWEGRRAAARSKREQAETILAGALEEATRLRKLVELHEARRVLDEAVRRTFEIDSRFGELRAQQVDIEAEGAVPYVDLDALLLDARKTTERAAATAKAATARRQIAELEAEEARLVGELAGREEAEAAGEEARVELDRARAQDQIRRDLAKKEVQLERLACDLDEVAPARAKADIEAEIGAAEAGLAEVGGAAERRVQREQTEAALKAKVEEHEEAKRLVALFAARESEILGTVSSRLTVPASKVLCAPVGLELVNHRGAPDCRITIDGVDSATISKGERLTFLGGLLTSLAPGAEGQWRVVLMDELEAISLERQGGGMGPREAFLRSMVASVEEGLFDQVILGGCPDTLPDVPGVTVIDFGAEAAAARAA